MRKWISGIVLCAMLLTLAAGAQAAGVTLRTLTPFADMDFAAQAYMDILTAWEEETGNIVEDYSGLMDETWMAMMADMVNAGEADVVVLPVGSGLDGAQLVPVADILAASPDCGMKAFPAMAEADGAQLLSPVRLNWEALYVNLDVLTTLGLDAPATFDELVALAGNLSGQGVLPVANALCDWPEIVLDCAALAGAPESEYGGQASLDGAKDVLTRLAAAGAFGPDPANMTDADCMTAFIDGAAAMRFDGDDLALAIPAERAASVMVISLPPADGQMRTKIAGTPDIGIGITRACWQDDARREAALSLVAALTKPESAMQLQSAGQSMLGASIAGLTAAAADCTGLLYDANPDGFDAWAQQTVNAALGM